MVVGTTGFQDGVEEALRSKLKEEFPFTPTSLINQAAAHGMKATLSSLGSLL